MSGSFLGDGFGPGFGGIHADRLGETLRDAFEQFRGAFDQKDTTRMSKGDVRTAILALLAEQPMHGYQIIAEIDKRSGGTWKPSPGSIYPTLQLLADEGAIAAEELNGRKTYSLTDQGRFEADAVANRAAPWEKSSGSTQARTSALPKAGIDLAQATAQVGRSGTPDQVQEAVKVLEDARRKLYGILSQG